MSTYSSLKFELITTGEQSGAWGNTTNTNLGTAIEQAIVGMASLTSADFPSNVATLTLADTNAAQDARALCLNIESGALSAAGTLNVPAIEKPYLVINGSSYAVTVKVSGQTGVSIPAGKRTVVYNNGTDVGNQIDYLASLSLGTALPISSGGTGSTSTTFVNLASNVTGTLPVANGGTGQTSYTDGQLLIGNSTGNTLTKATLTAGSGVTITNSAGSISISATGTGGTVTSVTGTSPVSVATGTTTPVISLASGYGDTQNPYAAKTANYVLAGPTTGASAAPSFRALVSADIPNNAANTSGTAGGLSSTLAISSGGTGQTTAASAITALTGTQVSGRYLRSDGTNATLSAIQAADVPTLNQNTSGTAAGLSSTLAITSGGTGQTTAASAITALTGTQVSGRYLRSDGTNATLSAIQAADVPTLNQNTTGTAAGLSSTLAISSGGTGQTTAANAITALTGTQTNGYFLRSNGTNAVLAAIQAADVPTLNQNTSGTAAGLSTTLAISSGGTGSTSASAARTNLGASTVGANFFTLTDPSAVTFPRMNEDNTVSALNAADFRTAIGAGSGGGSVTSVSGTGTVNGLTLTGTVTTSGDLTLGGTLSSIANSALTNSSISIGGTTISLGGSSTALNSDITVNQITVGRGTGSSSTNTAFGYRAINTATVGQTTNNTAVGYDALRLTTTGDSNTAIGSLALTNNTTAGNNTGVGFNSLKLVTIGEFNTALGSQSASGGALGDGNTAIGYNTMSLSDSSATYNVAVGMSTLQLSNATRNTAVGYQAGNAVSSGSYNSFFGTSAGSAVSSGAKNVIIGSYTGNSGSLDIRALSNYVALSDGDGNLKMYFNDTGRAYLPGITSGAGTYAVKWNSTTKEVTYDTSSARYKDNIRDSIYGLSHVMQMRSAQFEYKDTGRSDVGLIAEELDLIVPELVAKDEEGQPNAVSYDRMVSVLIKAVQEQQAVIESLTARLDAANL